MLGTRFHNHDSRIRYFPLFMERTLEELPDVPLPEGYSFVFYRPGDRDSWINIEISAREFATFQGGMTSWNLYFGPREAELENRMVFIKGKNGRRAATATALYDIEGRDCDGWLHWVAVHRDYQGKGLSKPLISHTLRVLRDLGYSNVRLSTQTTSWLACKIYLDMGFAPVVGDNPEGWRLLRTLTEHPSLSEFQPLGLDMITV